MKIVFINLSENSGGAAIAAKRLAIALLPFGVDVKELVLQKKSKDNFVIPLLGTSIQIKFGYLKFLFERLIIYVCNGFVRENLFKVSIANTGLNIINRKEIKDADIIHIHWINKGMMSVSEIKKIINLNKPIVWTMHDLWAATGICHYPGSCVKFIDQCYDCPLTPHAILDLSKLVFKQKLEAKFNKINYVGCSDWIKKECLKSIILKDANIISIPNPIDTSVFNSIEKSNARKELNLSEHKKYLLFGAAKVTDTRKGFIYFEEACNILAHQYPELIDNIGVLIVGEGVPKEYLNLPFKVISLGYINSDEKMAMIYSASDTFLIPSLEDNLPNTIMEAMACGVPCVGFNVGGIPEMIDHKVNGYVADYKSSIDFAEGVMFCLNNERLSIKCIEKVLANYSNEVIAKRYIKFYETLL